MSLIKNLAKKGKAQEKKHRQAMSEWYSLRSLLGNEWAIFYFLLGGREAGKSYATTDFFVGQWIKYGRPFYWMRLSETSAKKLLQNNAEKLIDPDLRRKYSLDIVTNGDAVYQVLERQEGTGKIKISVDDIVKEGIEVKVEESHDKWFGVTYHEDKEYVVEQFKELYDRGVYNEDLYSDLI